MTAEKLIAKIYPHLPLNREKRRYLRKKGITNGAGASGGVNFTTVFLHLIEALKAASKYDAQKLTKLVMDIDKGADYHDIEYWEGASFLRRVVSDWRYAKYVSLLVRSWTGVPRSYYVFLIVFVGLLRYGGAAYNYEQRRSIHEFLLDMKTRDYSGSTLYP